jgi:hypothetical protein
MRGRDKCKENLSTTCFLLPFRSTTLRHGDIEQKVGGLHEYVARISWELAALSVEDLILGHV